LPNGCAATLPKDIPEIGEDEANVLVERFRERWGGSS
jgi:hypothetical protein